MTLSCNGRHTQNRPAGSARATLAGVTAQELRGSDPGGL